MSLLSVHITSSTSTDTHQACLLRRKVIILQINEGFLSAPSAVEFPTEGGLTAFMNYYPPKNKVGPSNCHGLTSTSSALMLQQHAVTLCTGNYCACSQKHLT